MAPFFCGQDDNRARSRPQSYLFIPTRICSTYPSSTLSPFVLLPLSSRPAIVFLFFSFVANAPVPLPPYHEHHRTSRRRKQLVPSNSWHQRGAVANAACSCCLCFVVIKRRGGAGGGESWSISCLIVVEEWACPGGMYRKSSTQCTGVDGLLLRFSSVWVG